MYQETELPEIFYPSLSLGLRRIVQRKKPEHKQCVQMSVNRQSFMTLILPYLKAALWVFCYLIFLLNSSSCSHAVQANSHCVWMGGVSWEGRGLWYILIERVQKIYRHFTSHLWFIFGFITKHIEKIEALGFGPSICIFSFVDGDP